MHIRIAATGLALLLVLTCRVWGQQGASSTDQPDSVDLSPATWDVEELEKYNRLNHQWGGQNALASSDQGIVTGTTGAAAIRAGLEALNQGGTSADAALTTSLTQISLAQGAWVSYAGIMTMLYYDADSRQVYCMNAGYNTVRDEERPLTIPKKSSGRTALVPGYMAGVEAAHRRFGKLPFKELFSPAIYYAEQGFELSSLNASLINRRKQVLSRFPETRKVFLNPDTEEFYKRGEWFRQPELALTLRQVGEQGAAYMYHGAWAGKLVAAVQADGGRMTMEDLRRYRVLWNNPLRIQYQDYDVFAPGLPAQGGVHVAEALNLLQESDLKSLGHYTTAPESMFWLSQITNVSTLSFLPPVAQAAIFGEKTPLKLRHTREFAQELWQKMEAGQFSLTQKPVEGGGHSDAVVSIDRWGNVAAVVHTINTNTWGDTGLFVDGVSIPDSAAFQQALIAQTVPGQRLPDPTEPLVILHDGKPFAAVASIGSGLHQKTITSLVNLLDYEMDIKAALDAPSIHLPAYRATGEATQQVFSGDFSDDLIEGVKNLGLRIDVMPNNARSRAARGYIVGATIDAETGQRAAVATQLANAPAVGQE